MVEGKATLKDKRHDQSETKEKVVTKALRQAIKRRFEARNKKEKEKFQKMIDVLKSEIKLSKGDRGAAEDMPKKKAEQSIWRERYKRQSDRYMAEWEKEMAQQEMRKRSKGKFDMKKGGSVSKYSKGGGVRSAKYKI